ncbi:50S ribosomal protein L25/general stress protein Ctc [Kitasatospora aureofaciens]|uniref:Large ribosomal subunit protein bL25 n=1 Tax=Kitasatospora aureofaciens TaxID=1894 RepID=A0A1E7N189_KITAU|nr:50S ribosomal protein L25/general stress protein Ctc [Kitasatospora aureofaciens]QEV00164.1 50S ribosomal protein L25/general stress protein Ctc [Streptomyces viridifaciens]ARF78961.1 50S ribosomal protein L25/general stress protein Ctc [Kitasatospora aureofaciens]OEV34442.1 50S ribosomal protein L25/general stress protein Ctc [Kitasatospora aureofaciens]UKZ06362.1 50S ribosomal protein L25/general stress protein Ctc [Streptomyces viridifaciens]GGU83941.1 50S ribosomal protein L25 [Kitasato
MSEIRLAAETRTEFGKGAARRARRAGFVPGVVYGHGHAPVHLNLPGHDLMMALKTPNALLVVPIEGKDEYVLPKAVQREAIKRTIEHVDLLLVKRGEKVTVEIPVHTEGELAPGGNLLEHVLQALPVEAEATHLPEAVTVSVEGLEAGASVHAKDIALPAGVSLAVDADAVVLQVIAAQAAPVEDEAAEAEGAEA